FTDARSGKRLEPAPTLDQGGDPRNVLFRTVRHYCRPRCVACLSRSDAQQLEGHDREFCAMGRFGNAGLKPEGPTPQLSMPPPGACPGGVERARLRALYTQARRRAWRNGRRTGLKIRRAARPV